MCAGIGHSELSVGHQESGIGIRFQLEILEIRNYSTHIISFSFNHLGRMNAAAESFFNTVK
jgi:hypothetical protein